MRRTESQAALRRLESDEPGPGQSVTRLIADEVRWLRRNSDISVEFHWVPGHCGITENEAADAAAKLGTRHRCTALPLMRCDAPECLVPHEVSLAHLNRIATETRRDITKRWISQRAKDGRSFRPRKTWGLRDSLRSLPKRRSAVFLQLASGHALIGTHLVRVKKKESDVCWWCTSNVRQTRGHLFGECHRWRREYAVLKKEVDAIKGRSWRPRARLKAVDLFSDDRYTKVLLEYLAATEIGRRYEWAGVGGPGDGDSRDCGVVFPFSEFF
ncbi:hypothetical protein BZA77DRAFT_373516 [Pyronema omphalodes]|nr:hypothetical protein BZA77DRAFT_373516 [Pyronema omphalodes]